MQNLPAIPKKEIDLFNHEGTFNDHGEMVNEDGSVATDYTFNMAKQTMNQKGEKAFLEFMHKRNLGNHLAQKYKEKYENVNN